jgi:hypothetical protein
MVINHVSLHEVLFTEPQKFLREEICHPVSVIQEKICRNESVFLHADRNDTSSRSILKSCGIAL